MTNPINLHARSILESVRIRDHGERPARCSYCANQDARGCPSGGDPNSRFVILGESPGIHELDHEQPFCNPQGAGGKLQRIINQICDDRGIARVDIANDCFLINSINCNANNCDEGMKTGFSFTCRFRMLSEIFSSPRRLILILGNPAMRAFKNDPSLNITDMYNQIEHMACPRSGENIRIRFSYHLVAVDVENEITEVLTDAIQHYNAEIRGQ